MSIRIAEQRPPRVQFVPFDGTNADEVAQVSGGLNVEVQDDGSLLLKSWWSVSGSRVNVGDYVVNGPAGTQIFTSEADFQAAYTEVSS